MPIYGVLISFFQAGCNVSSFPERFISGQFVLLYGKVDYFSRTYIRNHRLDVSPSNFRNRSFRPRYFSILPIFEEVQERFFYAAARVITTLVPSGYSLVRHTGCPRESSSPLPQNIFAAHPIIAADYITEYPVFPKTILSKTREFYPA